MEYIWVALAAGALAFPHCLGMCGGFALHLAVGGTRTEGLGRQLLWHLGRIMTYVFLGALAGFLGNRVSLAEWPAVRNVAGYLVGSIMVLMGLSILGLLPARKTRSQCSQDDGLFGSLFSQILRKPSASSALILGLATGFLPCPITIALLGLSAGSASVLLGMGIMAAMGVGTVWALLILGVAGHAIGTQWKKWGILVVGVSLIALGGWTILRKAHVLPPLPGLHTSRDFPIAPVPGSCCSPR